MPLRNYKFRIPLESEAELKFFTEKALGINIPNKKVCKEHDTPFQAFADAYFAKEPVYVWHAARGFGGKSVTLAALGLTEAVTLKADVSILGGSGEQSQNVHRYNQMFWANDGMQDIKKAVLSSEPTQRETSMVWGNTIRALLASQTSVRGPHPQRLRCVAADSLISTPTGEYTINEIVSGQKIYSYDEHYGIIECEVIKSWCSGVKQTIDIGLENGKVLSVTPEHKILTSEGWKRAGQITVGESCISMCGMWERASRPLQEQDGAMLEMSEQETGHRGSQVHRLWSETIRGQTLKALHELLQKAYSETEKPLCVVWERDNTESHPLSGVSLRITGEEGESLYRLWCTTETDYNEAMPEMSFKIHVVRENGRKNGSCEGDCPEEKEVEARTKLLGASFSVELDAETADTIWEMAGGLCSRGEDDSNRGDGGILAQEAEEYGKGSKEKRAPGISWIHGNIPVDAEAVPMDDAIIKASRVSSIRKAREISVWDLEVKDSHNFIADGVVVHNCDEIDEMEIKILDAALGQPMSKNGVKAQTVLSSTWQNPNGTMTEILKRARHNGWEVKKWCMHETVQPHGWLPQEDIETKRKTVTEYMWETEYCLASPTAESRAIHPSAFDLIFDEKMGKFDGGIGQTIEIDPLTPEERQEWDEQRKQEGIQGLPEYVRFISGADWAKEKDNTIIYVFREDCSPMRLVVFYRMARAPWPVMVGKLDEYNKKYHARSHHDNTGLGDVINDYLETSSRGINMVGKARKDLLSNAINSLERGRVVMPYIRYIDEEFRGCSVNDVYGTGHLPDTLSAFALTMKGTALPNAIELFEFI